MSCNNRTQSALNSSNTQTLSRIGLGCFALLSLFCISQLACRSVKTGPKRVVLPYGKNYEGWKTLTKKRTTSSHKGFVNGLIYINKVAFPVSNGDDKFGGQYPVDSTFITVHWNSDNEKSPNLYVMRKMRNGYDPDNNDWRYTIVRRSDWTIEKDGRLVQCIQCHQKQIARDYVPVMRKDFTQPTY